MRQEGWSLAEHIIPFWKRLVSVLDVHNAKCVSLFIEWDNFIHCRQMQFKLVHLFCGISNWTCLVTAMEQPLSKIVNLAIKFRERPESQNILFQCFKENWLIPSGLVSHSAISTKCLASPIPHKHSTQEHSLTSMHQTLNLTQQSQLLCLSNLSNADFPCSRVVSKSSVFPREDLLCDVFLL